MKAFGYEFGKIKAAASGTTGRAISRNLTTDLTRTLNETYNFYYHSDSNPSLSKGISNYTNQDIIEYGRIVEGLDTHIRAIVEARMQRAASLPWGIFESDGNQVSQDDFDQETWLVYDALSGLSDFDADRLQMSEAMKHGYSVMQSIWSNNQYWFPVKLRHEYQENFDFDDGRSVNTLKPITGSDMLYMRPTISNLYTPVKDEMKWLVTTFDKRYEDRRGVGLYEKCIFASWAKLNIISWMMNFAERSGSGTWIAKIADADMLPRQENGDLYTAAEINEVLKSISVSSRGTLPSGVELEALHFDKDSDVEMFLRDILYYEQECSKIVNGGQSATTGLDSVGSFAAVAEFMNQERQVNLKHDINLIYEQINYPLVWNVLALNRSATVADNWLSEYHVSAVMPESGQKEKAETRKINAEADAIEAGVEDETTAD